MRMTFKEIEELKSMMTNYRIIHDDLSAYEKELDKMSEGKSEKNEEKIIHLGIKIKSCVESLKSQRIKEKKMYEILEKKYGPGQIDINTFEYKK